MRIIASIVLLLAMYSASRSAMADGLAVERWRDVEVFLIEVNHVYDIWPERTTLRFTQAIYWDEFGNIIAWDMLRNCGKAAPYNYGPTLRADGSCVLFVRHDGDHQLDTPPVPCRVYARFFREVWSTYDREVANRDICPIECRRGLLRD